MKILSVYQITYKNGFVQRKNLISHQDYLNIIKPLNAIIGELEASKKTERESKVLKRVISDLFGSEWFTDNSPLHEAIKTGILSLPPHQGGNHKCKLIKVK